MDYPSPWVFQADILLAAMHSFAERVIQSGMTEDMIQEARKIRDLIPQLNNMLLVEIPHPTSYTSRGPVWLTGDDASVRVDNPPEFPAEVRIRGVLYPVDNPVRMALALLAADGY